MQTKKLHYANGHQQQPPPPPNHPELAHYDTAAEKALIGSVLIDQLAFFEVDKIKSNHFYSFVNSQVWEGIGALIQANKPADFVTLANWLGDRHEAPEGGWDAFIIGYVNDAPSSYYATDYADIVIAKYKRRELNKVAGLIATMTTRTEEEIDDQIAQSEKLIFNIREDLGNDIVTPSGATGDFIDKFNNGRLGIVESGGIKTGFIDFDRLTGGLRLGKMTILAARPSMGKTTWALNIGDNIARRGGKVLFFSCEMTNEEIQGKRVSSLAGVANVDEPMKLSEDDYRKCLEAAGQLSTEKMYFDYTPNPTVSEIRSKAMRAYGQFGGLDLIIVDYLQLLKHEIKAPNKHLLVSHDTLALNALAKQLNTPMIVLSQLSRGVEGRVDKRPTMADARESGTIEEAAYMMVMLYCDGAYNELTEAPDITELLVVKNRGGFKGTVKVFNDLKHSRFLNLKLSSLDLL